MPASLEDQPFAQQNANRVPSHQHGRLNRDGWLAHRASSSLLQSCSMTRSVLSTGLWQPEWMRSWMSGEGMVHGFLGSVGHLSASTQALQHVGSFLSERFTKTTAGR
jgi:hypothetical protein